MIDLFTATPAEREIIERIAKRAVALYRKYGNTDVDELDIQMDLEACHCNGCPLRLADMEQADNFNFMHMSRASTCILTTTRASWRGVFFPGLPIWRGGPDAMTDPIYCYYHRHARLEIIQRHGQTYAVCPECRRIMTEGIRSELNRANHGNHLSSDDLVHKLINRAEPVNPIPPVYIYIDQP